MEEKKRVGDIMYPIEEYSTISNDSNLSEVLGILKKHDNLAGSEAGGKIRRTLFVTDKDGIITGKLTVYDVVKSLVPEDVKNPEHSRAFYSILSSRALEVADHVEKFQDRFRLLNSDFIDLVKHVCSSKVKDVMSKVYPLLKEDDTINQAIYVMFKENIRHPLVVRNGQIVGVVTFWAVFQELMEVLGPDCKIPL